MQINHLKAGILIAIFAMMIPLGEWFLRESINAPQSSFFEGLVLAALFALSIVYARSRILSFALTAFLAFGIIVEFASLSFFGHFASPMDIWLLFERFTEVAVATKGIISAKISTLLIITASFASLIALQFARRSLPPPATGIGHKLFDLLIILALAFYPVRILMDTENMLRYFSSGNYGFLRSYTFIASRFMAQTLPQEILGISSVKSYTREAPKVVSKPFADRIIFIVGESLSSHYVSALGYPIENSPFLRSEASNKEAILTKSFSVGLYTAVSVPSLVHMIKRPNAIRQITTHNSDLYRMAQEIGYKTAFLSVQSADGNSYTNLFKRHLDTYKDSFEITKDKYENIDDSHLLTFFKEFDAGEKSLILLNQFGSHEPYSVSKGHEIFGADNFLARYLNTVAYTDKIIERIKQAVESRFKDDRWVLIYTSDHGQHVTESTGGKGSFIHESNYEVPLYITSNTPEIMQEAKKVFKECEFAFHVQISEFIGFLLGYDNEISSCKEGYVNGSRLNGRGGYMKITQEGEQITREVIEK